MNEVAAILLAAGRSRRMGAFKPLLPFGETTVIESCLDSFRKSGVAEIVVVVGYRAEEIRRRVSGPSIRFAFNPDPDSEMSQSIACGVQELRENSKCVLIGLVDHPGVPPEVI